MYSARKSGRRLQTGEIRSREFFGSRVRERESASPRKYEYNECTSRADDARINLQIQRRETRYLNNPIGQYLQGTFVVYGRARALNEWRRAIFE